MMMGRIPNAFIDVDKYPQMNEMVRQMMGSYTTGGGRLYLQIQWLLELITWILVIALLASATRYLWKKASK